MLRHVMRESVRIESLVGRNQMQRARRTQRAEERGVAEIGCGRRDHCEGSTIADVDRLQHCAHIAGERRMAHRHALGFACRTGGVDQIRALCAMRPARQRGIGGDVERKRQYRCNGRRDVRRIRARVQQRDRAAVGHLRGVARGGQLRVERHPRRARLEAGEHAEHHLDAARRMNHDARFRPATRRHETRCERVRGGIEFGVGDRTRVVTHGDAIGISRDVALP
ncbi:hypothetical protein NOV72_05194 [Caballeronia novacaledonica]|uniref:Uncharacterized protein n=1 Tax=Caballeronia novacaledonica TaxID=1544861 RepID=A0A2U3ICQ1_9BURK|nr:hypothetical protein NOV72_05194 [Caballeronia novacaledonica]